MEDKTKVSLLYMLVGTILGVASAFLSILGVPNSAILILYIIVVYLMTYQYHLIGVKFERLGEKRWRSTLNGVWPSLLPWLVVWTMVFYQISPVIVLADASEREAAEGLGAYLESNGISVKITDDYSRHVFAHKMMVFGSYVPIPLGSSYGITAFPDIILGLLGMEMDRGTVTVEKVDSGEIIQVRKTGRLIIIISGQKEDRARIAQENRELLYSLLTQ